MRDMHDFFQNFMYHTFCWLPNTFYRAQISSVDLEKRFFLLPRDQQVAGTLSVTNSATYTAHFFLTIGISRPQNQFSEDLTAFRKVKQCVKG